MMMKQVACIVVLIALAATVPSAAAAEMNTTNIAAAPNPPVPTSPGSSSSPGTMISTLTPTLQWQASPGGADYYALSISKDPYGPSNVVVNQNNIYATSWTVPSGVLVSGTKYRWNMQAIKSGQTSTVSTTLYFQTSTPAPNPPVPTSPGTASEPGDTITTLTPTLQWQASQGGADYYSVYISKYPYGLENLVLEQSSIDSTSWTVPSGVLVSGTKYRWNMQAHKAGADSVYSSKLHFQTSITIPTTTPATSSEHPSTILSPVYGAVEVSTTGTFSSQEKWQFNQHGEGGHVEAGGICDADDTKAWDANLNYPFFDADYEMPVYAVESGKVVDYAGYKDKVYGNVLIEHEYNGHKWWSGYLHLKNIQVKLEEPPVMVTTDDIIGYVSNETDETVWGIIPYHLHFAVYTGQNEASKLKSFDATIVPRLPSDYEEPSPGNRVESSPETISDTTPEFSWPAVPGADYYGLYISKEPYGAENIVFNSDAYGDGKKVVESPFSLPAEYSLDQGGIYRWNMRAHTPAKGWGELSDRRYFKVGGTSNPDKPSVDKFVPAAATDIRLGGTVSFNYQVSAPAGLKQVELWRTDIENVWPSDPAGYIKKQDITGTSVERTIDDSPSSAGTYWYGLHVVDSNGQYAVENDVIKVSVTSDQPITDAQKQQKILNLVNAYRGGLERDVVLGMICREGGRGAFHTNGWNYNPSVYSASNGAWAQPNNGDGVIQVTIDSGYHEKSGPYSHTDEGYSHAIKDGCDYLNSLRGHDKTVVQTVLCYNSGPATLYTYLGRNAGDPEYLSHIADAMEQDIYAMYSVKNTKIIADLREGQKILNKYRTNMGIEQGKGVDYYRQYQEKLDAELSKVDTPYIDFESDRKTYDFGEPVEISYSVSTEKGIEEIEILRSDDEGKDLDDWESLSGICLIEDLTSYSNSFHNTPLYCGKYWYKIRVKDKEGNSFTTYETISIEVKSLPEDGKWLRIINEDPKWFNSISVNGKYCGYTNLVNINEDTQGLALSDDQINVLSENTDPALVNNYYVPSLEIQESLYAASTSYTVKAKKNGYLEDVQSISADFSGVKDITVSLLEDPNHKNSIDIVAGKIYIKGNLASPGDRINIEVDIFNDGELASGNFIVRGAILGGSEFGSIQINNLNPGERYTIDEWSTVWPADQDELLLWVWTDSGKTVSESDELNNLLVEKFRPSDEIPVSPTPEPTITPQPIPSIPEPDEPDCWIHITTDPIGSSVYLDGTYVDQSPVSLHATAGTHQLRIEKSGYETYSETLEFVEGEYPTKGIQLTPVQDIDTIIVDGSGGGDYVTIQGAVDASTPYDDIIIRYNNGIPYDVFSIDKEGVTIRAESDEVKPVIKTPNGEITIDASGITLKGLEVKDSAGIKAAGSKLSIIDCNIINNSKYNGGGVWLWNDGNDVLIEGTRFENNTAEFSGGGLLIYHAENVVIHNSEFINNTAEGGVAAARIDGSSRIEKTAFLNNYVQDKVILSSYDLILHNCLFENNNAKTIVYSSPETSSEIQNSKFISNDGCGVYLRLDSNAIGIVENSEFKGNGGPYGGLAIEGLSDINNHAEICHNTFIGNSGNSESVGIYLYNQYLNPPKMFIYDNYFNNTINIKQYRPASDSAVLTLNRTVIQKTNIIGGTNQGGNYWASPDGNGWSQKQIDTSGDGFTKAYYYEGVYDYHPLTYSVEIPSKPQGNFTGTPLKGKNTLAVEFTDLSDGNIVSYYWDFGDNYHSSERHPKHTYLNPGSYDVKLTVTDNDGDKSTLVKSDYVIVETTGMRPVAEWGDHGSGEGQLYDPRAIDVDSQSNVYVADSANNRIQKYNSGGTYISTWGGPSSGTGNLQFDHPMGIAVGKDDTVYVADTFNRRIQVVSSTGSYIRKWGSYGTSDGQFGCPQGIAQNSSGFIYVTENYANRNCQIFDHVGNFIRNFSFEGKQSTFDVDFDSEDNVYIADWNNRLVKLDKNNNLLWEFTGDEIAEPESFQPVSLALDSNDNIYVASSGDYRVWKISSDGEFLFRFGIDGSPDSKFDYPHGVAIDDSGFVYVLEMGSSKKINKFEPRFVDISPDFLVSSVQGEAPMTVVFSDNSTGEPSSWSWDFGDGNKGSGSVVTHTYENPGEYSVSMTVDNGIVERTKSCSNLITVSTPRPIAEYAVNVTNGRLPLSVQFNDTSIGDPTLWSWNFGDGSTSSEQNPKHTYYNAGVYDVTLTVSNEHGSDSELKSDYINVTGTLPLVTDPTAVPAILPTNTGAPPGAGETAMLSVSVTGENPIASVTIDLSPIGGSATAPMTDAGNGTWTVTTAATVASPFADGAYLPVHLPVNATNTDGASNTTATIPLTVVKNGDANQDNRITLYDAVYAARHVLTIEGYPMTESVGMVSGGDALSLHDAMYLAKYVLAVPGFEHLH